MDWAVRRQLFYALGILATLVILAAGSYYLFIFTPANCTDGVQNQGEFGPDCEGPCVKLCAVPRVDPLWARAVKVADGVYHGVALVKNPLAAGAATGLAYSLSIYDAENILIAERRGTLDLYAGETRSVFEPSILTGERIPVRAFMKVDGGQWTKGVPAENPIRIVSQTLDQDKLILVGTLENVTALPVEDIVADALLYDKDGLLVTASETKIAAIAARGRQDISYTWVVPFDRPVVRADIQVRLAK